MSATLQESRQMAHNFSHFLAGVPLALTNNEVFRFFAILYILGDSSETGASWLGVVGIVGLVFTGLWMVLFQSMGLWQFVIGIMLYLIAAASEFFFLVRLILDPTVLEHNDGIVSVAHIVDHYIIWVTATVVIVINRDTMMDASVLRLFRCQLSLRSLFPLDELNSKWRQFVEMLDRFVICVFRLQSG